MSEICDEVLEQPDSAAPPVVVDLELAHGCCLEPVGRLVAAGAASRLGMTVDRIVELQRAVDVTLRRFGSTRMRLFRLTPSSDALDVGLGPIAVGRADRAELERVLSGLVDEVATCELAPGEVWIHLRLPLSDRVQES